MLNRRGFLAGLAGIVAAPAIIRTIDLMPVKPLPNEFVLLSSRDGLTWISEELEYSQYSAILEKGTAIPSHVLFGEAQNAWSGIKDTKTFMDWQLRRRLEATENHPSSVFGDQMREMRHNRLTG